MNQRMRCSTITGLVLITCLLISGCAGSPPNPNDPKGKPVSHWIKKLQSDHAQDRSAAFAALGGSGRHAKEAVPVLIEVLKNREAADRRAAASLLGQIGAEAKTAAPALGEALKDKDAYVRTHAASALGGIGPDAKEAVPALIEALSATYRVKPEPPPRGEDVKRSPYSDTDAVTGQFREAIVDALARMGPAGLISVVKNNHPSVREKAGDVLRKMDGKAVVPDLMDVLKDPEPGLRKQALVLLAHIGADAKDAVPILLEALKDEDGALRMQVARALWLLDKHAAAIPTLMDGLKHADASVRAQAMHAVAAIGPDAKEAIPALIGFLGDKNETRDPAIAALRVMGAAAVPSLAEALKDKESRVCYAAAYVLRELGPAARDAVPALVLLLKAKDEHMRLMAADALGKIGPHAKAAVPALVQTVKLVNFKERSFAAEDIEMLAAFEAQLLGLKVARSTTEWLKGKTDANAVWGAYALELALFDNLRTEAAKALKKIDAEAPRAMVPELVEALKDKAPVLRFCSAGALRSLGPDAKSAVPALIAVLQDADPQIRESASRALVAIDPEAAKKAAAR